MKSISQVTLFLNAGWGEGLQPPPADQVCRAWGWGGYLASRDWINMRYRVMTMTSDLLTSLKSGECGLNTIYYPLADTQPFSTTMDSFIYGLEGRRLRIFGYLPRSNQQQRQSRRILPPPGLTLRSVRLSQLLSRLLGRVALLQIPKRQPHRLHQPAVHLQLY